MSETVGQAVEQVSAPKMITPEVTRIHPGRIFEYYRDIPRSCICAWVWRVEERRWALFTVKSECPWHMSSVLWSAEVRQP
jgi:hypothetical protein